MGYYHDKVVTDVYPPADNWKPTYYTEMKNRRSLGPAIVTFIETFLAPPRKMTDEEFRVREWQKWFLYHAFELNEEGHLRYSKLYLQIPRKNGKSFLASAICLYFLFTAKPGDELYVAAKNSKQARIVFKLAGDLVKERPLLQKVIKVGANELSNKLVRGAFFRPLSSDSGGMHGAAPFVAVLDEVHTLTSPNSSSTKGQDTYEALTSGSRDRNSKMLFMCTTAGNDDSPTGLAHNIYEYGKQVATGQIKDDSFGFYCWEAEDDDDIYDPKTWFKCNPQLTENLLVLKDFEDELVAAEGGSTAAFEKFALNKWIRGGDKAEFISGYHWKNALKPELGKIKKGENIYVGFDGSLVEDSSGIIGINDAGLIEVLYAWEKNPLDPEWFVDPEEIEAAMEKVFTDYNVLKLYADPSRHQTSVAKWRKAYGRNVVRDIPPSSSRMVVLTQEFKSEVLTGKLFHVGERRLSEHIKNTVETIKGTVSKERPNSSRKIDFTVCSILAAGARREVMETGKKKRGVVLLS
jgi:phage terminase large subunit-like protein